MTMRAISIPLLSSEECNEIVLNSSVWVEGTVFKFGKYFVNKSFRSVQISNQPLSLELLDNIFKTIFLTNSKTFRYHLEGYNEKDPPLVFRYSDERKDHYVWHTDTISGDMVRKLSFSIQLTDPLDYEGGDLEFMPEIKDNKIKLQGHMTIFPSFLTHRVSPVTKGTRHAIVGWIYGPEFR